MCRDIGFLVNSLLAGWLERVVFRATSRCRNTLPRVNLSIFQVLYIRTMAAEPAADDVAGQLAVGLDRRREAHRIDEPGDR